MITIEIPGAAAPKKYYATKQGRIIKGRAAREYETRVTSYSKIAMIGQKILTGPVTARIMVTLAIPRSWSKHDRVKAMEGMLLPVSRPDLDNYVKSTLDGMTKGEVWQDDSQVTDLQVTKRYGVRANVLVRIKGIEV